MEIKDISIEDFVYDLPDDRIAKYPLEERDKSKLLLYKDGKITDNTFNEISELLPANSVIVRNNTKVIRARLIFKKPTGAKIEVFCLDPSTPNSYELSLSSKNGCSWHCMLGNAKRWKIDSEPLTEKVNIGNNIIKLSVKRTSNNEVHFYWDNSNFSFSEILDALGILPIPPYLNRETEDKDNNTYQTVYAEHSGSVAAPTAGLHFTDEVNKKIKNKGIDIIDVTLHVGAGTFKPVKTEKIGGHDMHRELILVERSSIKNLLDAETKDKNIIAVGTTSVRTLESLFQLSRLIKHKVINSAEDIVVKQWQSYEDDLPTISRQESLEILLSFMNENKIDRLIFPTEIMIAPGYKFGFVDGIITNFHQPHSTLLLLISAFTQNKWRIIYEYALRNNYRFLSYGDSSLLLS